MTTFARMSQVRREIQADTYETPEKLSAAMADATAEADARGGGVVSYPPDDVPQAVHEHYESLYDRLQALEASHAELLKQAKTLRDFVDAKLLNGDEKAAINDAIAIAEKLSPPRKRQGNETPLRERASSGV